LAYRNGVELTHARWESDVQVLIKALLPYVDGALAGASPSKPPSRSRRTAVMAAALVIAFGTGIYLISRNEEKPATAKTEPEKPVREKTASDAMSDRVEPRREKATAERVDPGKTESDARVARAEAERSKAIADRMARERAVDRTLQISGVWRDSNYPANGYQVTQNGSSFSLTGWGVLPDGNRFQSSGSGTLAGQRYTSQYNARYQTGQTSRGDCSGTVSTDARRIQLTCRDSLLGTFPLAAIRQ